MMTKERSAVRESKPNPDWAALPLCRREGWTRVPFGAFAESVNVRVEPADAAEEVYVGLDDLDSGCLHIRRWGKGSDVIGSNGGQCAKRGFFPQHVAFGGIALFGLRYGVDLCARGTGCRE
ncbi:MAG: hypothetical protein ACR2OZ_02330, partial [Verrucomicrobiales bacterium]